MRMPWSEVSFSISSEECGGVWQRARWGCGMCVVGTGDVRTGGGGRRGEERMKEIGERV